MQQLLASLVVAMDVRDAAFTAGMASARKNAAQTGQEIEKSADRMESAVVRAARAINDAMLSIADAVAEANRKVIAAGAAMTVGLTVPLAMMGKSAKNTAADFETAMNGVRAALLKASPKEIAGLADAAMTMGPRFGRSASEAANAIEGLAKTGLSAADILNGGLKSALTLAVVGQTDMGRATAISTDIMAQFERQASELPGITDKVVGALDATKMAADDYAQAIGQVGGIAGGLGYQFEDTNVAIAALSTSFDSGSSAGTALKSMLLQLKPTSEDAAKVFDRVGKATTGTAISFFEADGRVKSFAETAEILRQTFGRLNPESQQDALKRAFGADGMAAAIALMKEGAAGMEDLRQSINGVTADEKLAVLLEGDAAASRRLSSAIETLSIKIGSILLPVFTAVKNAAAAMIEWLANLPPAFHYAWVAAGALAAAFGPLIVAVGIMAKIALPLLAARFAAIPIVLGLIINPMGTVIALLGRLAVAMGASAAVGLFAARIATLATGIGVVVGIVSVLIPLMFRVGQATDAARIAQDKANEAQTIAAQKTEQLALASGKLRGKLLDEAKAAREAARDTMLKARADVMAAQAAAVRAREESGRMQFTTPGAAGAVSGAIMGKSQTAADAEAEWQSRLRTFGTFFDTFDLWDRKIKEAEKDSGASAGLAVGFDDPEKKKKGKKGRDAARDEAAYLDELGRLRVQALEAQAELTGSIEKRYDADIAAIEEDRAAFARNVKLDEGLTDAKRASLIAAQDIILGQRQMQAEQDRSRASEAARYGLLLAVNEAQQEEVQAQIDAADSVAARRAGQLRLLDLQRQHEAAMLDEVLATKDAASLEYSNAQRRRDQLDAIYADRAEGVRRDTAGPLESYRRELNRSAEAVNESIEAIEVSGFERLNDWMADAAMGADNLAKSFSDMATAIVRDLIRIVIQQQLIKPLANRLMGGGEGGGGGLLSGLLGTRTKSGSGLVDSNPDRSAKDAIKEMGMNVGGLGGLFGAGWNILGKLSFGGGKASGGRVSPGSWYMVGEQGPEPFVPDTAGTILPTSATRGGGGGTAKIEIVEHPGFAARVVGISGDVSVATQRAGSRRSALAQRQQLPRR